MRQIKFRGKRIDDGEWIYGFLADVQEQYGYATINSSFDDEDGLKWETCDYVDVNTVGQFTGAFDGAGTEIYEGDLLFCDEYNPFPYKVYWSDSLCCFKAIANNRNEIVLSKTYLYVGFRVIGNIHEK